MNLKKTQKPKIFKKSYGIACCRYNLTTKLPEILMIKKRYTYAFFDFVFTKYKKNDDDRLCRLFDQMSIQEKADILRLDFDILWARIRIKIPIQPKSDKYTNEYNKRSKKSKDDLYIFVNRKYHPHKPIMLPSGYILYDDDWYTYRNKKIKFKNNFISSDGGKWLKKLINGTKSCDTIWEIPKGRPDRFEKPINTAIREFKEETDISIYKYTFLPHIKPIIISYIVNRCSYTHIYYIAVAKKFNWEPQINFSSYEQMTEVEKLQWISYSKAKHLNLKQTTSNTRMLNLLKKIINSFV